MSTTSGVMLRELLPEIDGLTDCYISGITLDSRKVKQGDLFLAVDGDVFDGRDFVNEALAAGATAVLYDDDGAYDLNQPRVQHVSNLKARLGKIASDFFGSPSSNMEMIGITGTNGKTSCCHYIAQALSQLGDKCGIVGTLGYGLYGDLKPLDRTTPNPVEFQQCLAELRQAGAHVCCFEASSHGLVQGRLDATSIDVAVFTNVSRDHLDYHNTFSDYLASKRLLFEAPGLKMAVCNVDDPNYPAMIGAITGQTRVIGYGVENPEADINAVNCEFDIYGSRSVVITPWGDGDLKLGLLGEFNLSNALVAVAVGCSSGHPIADVLEAVALLRPVKGRMDVLRANSAMIVIDYAHTPDALSKVLDALRMHCKGRLWCMFGCGGERDRGKRELMGAVAAAKSDVVILTSDNPRGEEPTQIIAEILQGIESEKNVLVEPDRRKAIESALSGIAEGDILLVAGKGHEDYQEVSGERLPFSDYEEISRVLA